MVIAGLSSNFSLASYIKRSGEHLYPLTFLFARMPAVLQRTISFVRCKEF